MSIFAEYLFLPVVNRTCPRHLHTIPGETHIHQGLYFTHGGSLMIYRSLYSFRFVSRIYEKKMYNDTQKQS